MTRIRFVLMLFLLMLTAAIPVRAQDQAGQLLSVRVSAGFGGYIRPNMWFPLHVTVNNQGNNLTGRLLIRPETSGDEIYNTYSTAVDIASGSTQQITLYITARSNARDMRVELITDDGQIVAVNDFTVRVLESRERLYLTVSSASTGAVDLSPVAAAGYTAQQILWNVDRIPNRPGVLDSLDVILFSDADTGSLSPSQREAISAWVARGGHLIVTGGAGWQATAAGLRDLLPLIPNTSSTTDDLSSVAALAAVEPDALTGQVIRAEGELIDGAQVLAASDDGQPLIARRSLGSGTVDYLAFDLTGQPLRGWDELHNLWFTLLTSTGTQPGWTTGLTRFGEAVTAVEILPGINLLPAALSLLFFLVAYVALIGPLNYLVLSRLNRRELAWFSIPVTIAVFSVLAWNFGAELRGNTVRLSRLSVVQSWPDSEQARLDQLMGLLAPRRGDYSLLMDNDRLLRPISGDLGDYVLLSTNSAIEIRQGARFEATNFPVDASFIQAFSADGTIPRPDIGGRLVRTQSQEMVEDLRTNTVSLQTVNRLQGTIYNNTELTLTDPVILGQGLVYHLEQDLEPGALVTLDSDDLLLPGNSYSPASPLELAAGFSDILLSSIPSATISRSTARAYFEVEQQSAREILGEDAWNDVRFGISFSDDTRTQENRRRQALLSAFMVDQYASTGRGDRIYLAAWSDTSPTNDAENNDDFDFSDSTLYIVELAVEAPQSGPAQINPDQFTWVSTMRSGSMGDVGPNNFFLADNTEFTLRFTPVASARLSRVDALTIFLRFPRAVFITYGVEIWNWEEQVWDLFAARGEDYTASVTIEENVSQYIGPLNAVEVRLTSSTVGSQMMIEQVGARQAGRF